jgi:hypothetical protein
MDTEFKAKWVAALRSGKYQQGAGFLCSGNEGHNAFCCLGVALDLQGASWAARPISFLPSQPLDCTINGDLYKSNGKAGDILPAFAGLRNSEIDCLMSMNDSGKTFSEIADFIEPSHDHPSPAIIQSAERIANGRDHYFPLGSYRRSGPRCAPDRVGRQQVGEAMTAPRQSSSGTERLRQVLGPFYKTVDVMKSARNSETKLMNIWAEDMKAVEDVMLFLEDLRDGKSSDGGVEVRHAKTGNKAGSIPEEAGCPTATRLVREAVQGAAIQPCAGVTPGPSEAIAWLDMRSEPASDWTKRIVATNPDFVEKNGRENFVALVPHPAGAAQGSVSCGEDAIREAAESAAVGANIVRSDGDLLVYYSGFNLSRFIRYLALSASPPAPLQALTDDQIHALERMAGHDWRDKGLSWDSDRLLLESAAQAAKDVLAAYAMTSTTCGGAAK